MAGRTAAYLFEFYLHLFQSFASHVEAWLAPGTILEPENDALYASAFLFNPSGETVGRQRQMHPTVQQLNWGVQPGDITRIFETEVGDLGFVIGDDIHHPEIARGLAQKGATLLLHPAALGSHHGSDGATLGKLRDEVQATHTFGMQANFVGGDLRGHSAIYAPTELTESKSGILAQATSDEAGEILLADLDYDALEQLRAAHPAGK